MYVEHKCNHSPCNHFHNSISLIILLHDIFFLQLSFDLSEYTADVDGLGTLRLLDAIRTCGLEKQIRFYQVCGVWRCVCICMYMWLCVCVCICVHLCVSFCVYICVYLYCWCLCMTQCVCVYLCVSLCVYICVYLYCQCLTVCVDVFMYMYIYRVSFCPHLLESRPLRIRFSCTSSAPLDKFSKWSPDVCVCVCVCRFVYVCWVYVYIWIGGEGKRSYNMEAVKEGIDTFIYVCHSSLDPFVIFLFRNVSSLPPNFHIRNFVCLSVWCMFTNDTTFAWVSMYG